MTNIEKIYASQKESFHYQFEMCKYISSLSLVILGFGVTILTKENFISKNSMTSFALKVDLSLFSLCLIILAFSMICNLSFMSALAQNTSEVEGLIFPDKALSQTAIKSASLGIMIWFAAMSFGLILASIYIFLV